MYENGDGLITFDSLVFPKVFDVNGATRSLFLYNKVRRAILIMGVSQHFSLFSNSLDVHRVVLGINIYNSFIYVHDKYTVPLNAKNRWASCWLYRGRQRAIFCCLIVTKPGFHFVCIENKLNTNICLAPCRSFLEHVFYTNLWLG